MLSLTAQTHRCAVFVTVTLALVVIAAPRMAYCWSLLRRPSKDVRRLRELVRKGSLMHPQTGQSSAANFCHLASALARCCGAHVPSVQYSNAECAKVDAIVADIGGAARQHVVFVLCDGMGSAILEKHLPPDSFLRSRNDANRLRAVFPSTTPAALTTLATTQWPGRHGMPGWDLRDHAGVDFPGDAAHGPVQLRVLDQKIMDMRSHRPAHEVGFNDDESILCAQPWSRFVGQHRHLTFISAYASTQFTTWSTSMGGGGKGMTSDIGETSSETLGKPEGSHRAIEMFHEGVDAVLRNLDDADSRGVATFTQLYTAHPDKHMHALGVEHTQVMAARRACEMAMRHAC